jgi:hypothetical protein
LVFRTPGDEDARDVAVNVIVAGPDGLEIDQTVRDVVVPAGDVTGWSARQLLVESGRIAAGMVRGFGPDALIDKLYTIEMTATYRAEQSTQERGVRAVFDLTWTRRDPLSPTTVTLGRLQSAEP